MQTTNEIRTECLKIHKQAAEAGRAAHIKIVYVGHVEYNRLREEGGVILTNRLAAGGVELFETTLDGHPLMRVYADRHLEVAFDLE